MNITMSAPTTCDLVPVVESSLTNEVDELRECLRRSQIHCKDVEQERDYNAAKAKELNQVLEDRMAGSESPDQLINKAVQVAELNHEADVLQSQLCQSMTRIKKLEQERETHRTMLMQISRMIQSTLRPCDHEALFDQLAALRNNDKSKENDSAVNHTILTPQDALDMTMSTLRAQIETLEEERHGYIRRIRTLQNFLEEQRRENEARELKIMALERQMEEFVSNDWTAIKLVKELHDKDIVTAGTDEKALENGRSGKRIGWRIRGAARRK